MMMMKMNFSVALIILGGLLLVDMGAAQTSTNATTDPFEGFH